MNTSITLKQQHWLEHSLAADKSELTLSEYAKQHQLNINAFYNGRNMLRKKGLIDAVEENLPAFIKVLPKPVHQQHSNSTDSVVIIELPNGLKIDVPCVAADVTQLIQRLMRL